MALGVTRAPPTHTRMLLAHQLVVTARPIALPFLVVLVIQHASVIQATKDKMGGLVSSVKLGNIDHRFWLNALPVHHIQHLSPLVMSLGIAFVWPDTKVGTLHRVRFAALANLNPVMAIIYVKIVMPIRIQTQGQPNV